MNKMMHRFIVIITLFFSAGSFAADILNQFKDLVNKGELKQAVAMMNHVSGHSNKRIRFGLLGDLYTKASFMGNLAVMQAVTPHIYPTGKQDKYMCIREYERALKASVSGGQHDAFNFLVGQHSRSYSGQVYGDSLKLALTKERKEFIEVLRAQLLPMGEGTKGWLLEASVQSGSVWATNTVLSWGMSKKILKKAFVKAAESNKMATFELIQNADFFSVSDGNDAFLGATNGGTNREGGSSWELVKFISEKYEIKDNSWSLGFANAAKRGDTYTSYFILEKKSAAILDSDRGDALVGAAHRGEVELLEYLLAEEFISRYKTWTLGAALQEAARSGSYEKTKLLIGAAGTRVLDGDLDYAFAHALNRKNVELAKLIYIFRFGVISERNMNRAKDLFPSEFAKIIKESSPKRLPATK